MKNKPKITFLDSSTMDPGDLDLSPLNEFGDCTFYQTTNEQEILSNIADSKIIITNKVNIDSSTIAKSTALKLIVVCATGVNNIDLNAAKENGITVCNVANYSTPIVAQHTLALLLNLCGNTHKYLSEKNSWPESPIFTRLTHPEWPRITKDDFFSQSDVISLHCPLTKENEHIINSTTLSQMKSTSYLINTSRGG